MSSRLAPPPPPLLPLLLFHCVNMTESPTHYLKLQTDGIGERCESSTTRQVGKLESLMEQMGVFFERLFGWHTLQRKAADSVDDVRSFFKDEIWAKQHVFKFVKIGIWLSLYEQQLLAYRLFVSPFCALLSLAYYPKKKKVFQLITSLLWLRFKCSYGLCHLITKPS